MMGDILAHLFRLDPDGRPMTIMQLARLPSEVVDAVVCVCPGWRSSSASGARARSRCCVVCEERIASPRPIAPSASRRPAAPCRASPARAETWRPSRLGHAASGRTRRDHHVAMQHPVRHADDERARSGLPGRSGIGRQQPAHLHPVARTGEVIAFGEGVPIPRPDDVPAPPVNPPAAQRHERRRGGGRRGGRRRRLHRCRRGAVAGRDHEQGRRPRPRSDRRRASRTRDGSGGAQGAALDHVHRRLLRRPLDAGDNRLAGRTTRCHARSGSRAEYERPDFPDASDPARSRDPDAPRGRRGLRRAGRVHPGQCRRARLSATGPSTRLAAAAARLGRPRMSRPSAIVSSRCAPTRSRRITAASRSPRSPMSRVITGSAGADHQGLHRRPDRASQPDDVRAKHRRGPGRITTRGPFCPGLHRSR